MRISSPLRFAILAVLLILYFSEWRRNDLRPSDFAAFYSGAILWEQGHQPYDPQAVCDVQARIGVPVCLPFFHPPVLLPLISAVSNGDYAGSFLRWAVVLSVVLVLCAIPLQKLASCDLLDVLLYLTFFPVFVSILQGQDTAFVLLGVLLCAFFLRDGKDNLAGIALGLTVLRPHLAIAISIPILFARPKAFRAFFLTGLVLVVYSLALVGPEGFRGILNTVLITAKDADATTQQRAMYNLVGIFSRLGISAFWAWPIYIGSIVLISILWRRRGITLSTFGLCILCALFTSPHLHAHDLSLLLVPLLAWPAFSTPLLSIGFIAAIVFAFEHLFVYALMLTIALTSESTQFIFGVRSLVSRWRGEGS